MKKKKIIALFLFLFILLQLPFGASALVFKDPLTAQTRGIHTISNYEQMDLGRAGELRVNEYNQELLLTREELSPSRRQSSGTLAKDLSLLSDRSKLRWALWSAMEHQLFCSSAL